MQSPPVPGFASQIGAEFGPTKGVFDLHSAENAGVNRVGQCSCLCRRQLTCPTSPGGAQCLVLRSGLRRCQGRTKAGHHEGKRENLGWWLEVVQGRRMEVTGGAFYPASGLGFCCSAE